MKVIDIQHSINTRVCQLQNKNRGKIIQLHYFILLSKSISRWLWSLSKKFWTKSRYNFNKSPFFNCCFCDFNFKSNLQCKSQKTPYEGSGIVDLTSEFNEPTYLTKNSSSCIDLMFTSQPTLVMEPGLNSSLHKNCQHQIIYSKFNLKIYSPPPYER